MTVVLHIALAMIAIPAIFASTYLLVLTLRSSRPSAPRATTHRQRFDVIVPAHNEADVIARTVYSLRRLDWPKDQFRILVVADNCTDDTAAIARTAGASVWARTNDELRGKGYALDFAFRASRLDAWANAVVIIDADAEVSLNLLEAFAARLDAGEHAVQAHYGVLNPWASWRTRLITIAKASFHIVRSRAREHFGVSCGIRGNGWCVTHELIEKVPYRAFSLTEDLEYGIDLGLAGFRVAYADEARADAEMVSGEQIASKQRQRWESGRFALIKSKTGILLAAALRLRSATCLDLAFDLMVLPLSYVALNITLLTASAAVAGIWWPQVQIWVWIGAACAAAVTAYVIRGWQLSGIGWHGVLDLCRAPAFLAWKLLLMLRRRQPAAWVRTQRERR